MRTPAPSAGLALLVAKDAESMGRMGAEFILRELRLNPDLVLCASAGGTPRGTYLNLVEQAQARPRLFRRLRVLQIDEWGGLPAEHPATCRTDLRHQLVQPLRIPANRFMGFRGDGEPGNECARIRRWLATNGPIDVCILGLGLNGHVGMNEPGDRCEPFAHVAKLARSSLQHPMLRALKKKPRYGLTLGIGEILQSRRILLLVSGAHKRHALSQLLKAKVTTRFPASLLWLHPKATVLCDEAALGKQK